jgi:hypothetical protein
LHIIKEATQAEVWEHWYKTENSEEYQKLSKNKLTRQINDWRPDIKANLPNNLKWHLAEPEEADIDKMYIIFSADWEGISRRTYLADVVRKNVNKMFFNQDSIRIANDIKKKINYLETGGILDTRLILIADNPSGPFTVIEGNRRSVAFLSLNRLLKIQVYLGISDNVKVSRWARGMYNKKTALHKKRFRY